MHIAVDPNRRTKNDQLNFATRSETRPGLTESTTQLVGKVKGAEGGDKQDDVEDEDDREDIGNTQLLEENSDVVGHERDSLCLLERLQTDGDERSSEIWPTEQLEEGNSGMESPLFVKVCLDFLNLFPNQLVRVGSEGVASERSQDTGGFLQSTLSSEPSGGFREESRAEDDGDGKDELEADG